MDSALTYQTLFDHCSQPIVVVDSHYLICLSNPAFLRFLQYAESEALPADLLGLIAITDLKPLLTLLLNGSQAASAEAVPIRFRTAMGHYRTAHARAVLLSGAEGHFCALFLQPPPPDISAQPGAPLAFLAETTLSSRISVLVTDRMGRTQWVNEGFTRLTGYSSQEAAGQSPGSLLQGPLTDSQTVHYMNRCIQDGIGFEADVLNYRKNQQTFWMHIHVEPVVDTAGQVKHFIGMQSDITTRKQREMQLEAEATLLRTIQDSTPAILFALDPHYRYLSFNKRHAETMQHLYGIGVQPGMNALEIIQGSSDFEREKHCLNRALANEAISQQAEFGPPTLNRRYFDVSYHPLNSAALQPAGVVVYAQDITEEQMIKRENALLFSEVVKYKDVLDKSALIAITDPEGRVREVNNLFCRTTQYSREELMGQNLRLLKSDYHPESFYSHMWQTISQGTIWRGEICNKAKDGSLYWVDMIIHPLMDQAGTIVEYLSLRYNITQRKIAEKKLIESEARLKEAQQVARIGHWEYSQEMDAIYWSDEVFSIYGRDPAEGMPSREQAASCFHPEDAFLRQQMITTAYKNKEQFNVDIRILRADAQVRYVNIIGYPVVDATGQVIRYRGTLMDIHERKMAENQLQARLEELTRVNEQLDMFVAVASHDLRAPLASVLSIVELCADETELGEIQANVSLIERNVLQLDQLLSDLIDVSRTTRTEVQIERISLDQLIQATIESLSYTPEARLIDTTVQVSEEASFYSDPLRLAIIFNNLLSNAFRYSDFAKPSPWIRIRVHIHSDTAVIQVQDNGIGIGAPHLERLFDRFYRATKTKEGSGLGLYLVKQCVDSLGGTIEVRSTLAEGSEFIINLPNQSPIN